MIRATAKRMLKEAPPPPPLNPPNPGMAWSPEYAQHRYLDLGSWRRNASGNYIHHFSVKGVVYRIILFRHKKTPTYGWLRTIPPDGEPVFSGKFNDIGEAHRDSWRSLQTI